jgi:hypothetical protein
MKFRVLLILLSFFILKAQDDRLDEFTFEETQFEEKTLYFGIGGGYSGSFFIQDMTDINNYFKDLNVGVDELKDNMYHHGLELMSSTVILPNTRIGFFRYSGSSEVSSTIDVGGETYTRLVDVRNFMTGVPFEYAFMPFKSFAIIPSLALGYGNYNIDLSQAPDKVDFNATNNENYFMQNIATTYWFAMPRLQIEYAFTQFTVIRMSAFYMTSFAQDWKLNKEATLENVPDGFNPNGYAIQIGLFLGLFNY